MKYNVNYKGEPHAILNFLVATYINFSIATITSYSKLSGLKPHKFLTVLRSEV